MFLNDASVESQLSNCAISRYMWSLRDLPCAGKVEAVWMLYAPKVLVRASSAGPRPRSERHRYREGAIRGAAAERHNAGDPFIGSCSIA
jgi:hypothetical protein